MSNENQDNMYQGRPLTDELATARNIRQTGEIDMRKFTVLPAPLLPSMVYLKIRSRKNSAMLTLYDEVLNLLVGVDGTGMRYAIRGESVRKGIASNPDSEMPQRPGLASRLNPFDGQAKEDEAKYQQWKKETQV